MKKIIILIIVIFSFININAQPLSDYTYVKVDLWINESSFHKKENYKVYLLIDNKDSIQFSYNDEFLLNKEYKNLCLKIYKNDKLIIYTDSLQNYISNSFLEINCVINKKAINNSQVLFYENHKSKVCSKKSIKNKYYHEIYFLNGIYFETLKHIKY